MLVFLLPEHFPVLIKVFFQHAVVLAGEVIEGTVAIPIVSRPIIGVLRHDAARQRLEQSHVSLSSRGVRTTPVVQRYAWPAELDLMARMAGMHLVDRWADWTGTPFTADSGAHVSVWRRA